jgi:DnaJ-class molecular chaperone
MAPEIDGPDSCEMCRGTGAVAYGPWGARPPKKKCPECGGNGWREGKEPNPVGPLT